MKIQLDTTNKTIKLEEDVKLDSLVKMLGKLLPNGEWKQFTLQTHTTIYNWNNPIIIEKYVKPYQPYYEPYKWYCTNTSTNFKDNSLLKAKLNSGIYNVEVSDKLI